MNRTPRRPAAAAALALLAVTLAPRPAAASEPADPLRLVPRQAGFVLKVNDPRALAEAVLLNDAYRDALALPQFRTAVDTAAFRRFAQLVGHVERELGGRWPDVLDRVAGGGVAVGLKVGGPQPPPVVLVSRGRDAAAVGRAFDLFLDVLGQEAARQGGGEKPAPGDYRGAKTARVGADFHAARVGDAIVLANRDDALRASLDLALGADKSGGSVADHPTLPAAKALLPADPLAWFWLDFAAVKEEKAAKDFFDNTKKDVLFNLVLGGTVDCLRRADFVAGALVKAGGGFRFTVRLPAGREGFAPELALHAPPAGTPGSLPPLEPPGVLYSQSFYLDLAAWWRDRDKLIAADVLKQLEKAEKDASRFVPGRPVGEVLSMWGPHHRVVAVNLDAPPYKTAPAQRLPGFAVVTSMRDPEFGKAAERALRAAALLGGAAAGLTMSEHTHDGVRIVAYRFPEDRPPAFDDPGNQRFNFEPCFATVGDQFLACSTVETCKKVIAEVRRTAKLAGSADVWRARAYMTAAADAVAAVPDPFVTGAVLGQGVGLEEARTQVDALVAWLRSTGTVRIELEQGKGLYRLDFTWAYGK